jgi:hypothetical protein
MPLEKKKRRKNNKRKNNTKRSKRKSPISNERKKGSKSCTKVDNFTLQDTQMFPQNTAHKIVVVVVVVVEMCFELSSLRDHYCLLLFFPFLCYSLVSIYFCVWIFI